MSLLSAVLEAEAEAKASFVASTINETSDIDLKNVKHLENGYSTVESGSPTLKKVGDGTAALAAAEDLATDVLEALVVRYIRVSGCAGTKIPCYELLAKRRQQILDAGISPLQDALLRLEAATTACEWSDRIQHASRLLERKKWQSAAKELRKLTADFDLPPNQHIPKPLILAMRDFVSSKRARCLAHVTAQWKSILRWFISSEVIVLKINVSDRQNLQEILNALYVSERIDAEIAEFADFFLKTIVPSIIFEKSSLSIADELGVIHIKIKPGELIDDSIEISTIVNNLMLFFDTIHSSIDCKWEDYRTVFSIFGQIVGEDFFDIFVSQFLDNRLSADSNSTEKCLQIASDVEKFGNYLCTIGFVEAKTNPLSQYTAKYNDFIYEKKCEKLLCISRAIIKNNLQKDVVKVCEGQTFEIDADKIKIFEKEVSDRNLLFFPFMMSECSISDGVRHLLELVFTELETAQNFSLKFGNKLILTLKSLFELYYMLVPQFHGDSLKDDPLDLALFYNNCFYLAHGIIGYLWNKNFCNEFATYVNIQLSDQIYNLRLSAITKFSMFIKKEQALIEKIINSSDLNSFDKSTDIPMNGEMAISNCLNRCKHLQRCWQNILSAEHYEKALAELIDCISKELIQCIKMMKEEMISEDLADDLHSKFTYVLTSVPSLFNENSDIKILSKNYCRLNEITSLLKCPMFAIANKWSKSEDLSLLFTSEEIKHFIKVMFPSSLQKSAVLNKIL